MSGDDSRYSYLLGGVWMELNGQGREGKGREGQDKAGQDRATWLGWDWVREQLCLSQFDGNGRREGV